MKFVKFLKRLISIQFFLMLYALVLIEFILAICTIGLSVYFFTWLFDLEEGFCNLSFFLLEELNKLTK